MHASVRRKNRCCGAAALSATSAMPPGGGRGCARRARECRPERPLLLWQKIQGLLLQPAAERNIFLRLLSAAAEVLAARSWLQAIVLEGFTGRSIGWDVVSPCARSDLAHIPFVSAVV